MALNADRIEHYLRMAKDLRVLAAKCGEPSTAAAYLELAAMWVRLADEAGYSAANDADGAADAESRSNEA